MHGAAYRKQALECHPDKAGAAIADDSTKRAIEAKFREIQEAYDVLSDPARRREYDSVDDFDDSLPIDCAPADFFKASLVSYRCTRFLPSLSYVQNERSAVLDKWSWCKLHSRLARAHDRAVEHKSARRCLPRHSGETPGGPSPSLCQRWAMTARPMQPQTPSTTSGSPSEAGGSSPTRMRRMWSRLRAEKSAGGPAITCRKLPLPWAVLQGHRPSLAEEVQDGVHLTYRISAALPVWHRLVCQCIGGEHLYAGMAFWTFAPAMHCWRCQEICGTGSTMTAFPLIRHGFCCYF